MHNTNPLDATAESAIVITKIVLTIDHKNKLPDDLLAEILFRAYMMIGGEGGVVAKFVEPKTEMKAEVYDPFKLEA